MKHLESQISSLPDTTGVYYFMSADNVPLYIGKSLNIRTRIKSHWTDAKSNSRKQRLWQQTDTVTYQETAGEFTALYLEAQEIKQRAPLYNRQLRQQRNFCSLKLVPDAKKKIQFVRRIALDELSNHYGLFKNQHEAKDYLTQLCETTTACKFFCGLSARKPCFQSQLNRCQSSCLQTHEPLNQLNALQAALASIKLKQWPYDGIIAVKEHCANRNLTHYILLHQWCFLGIATSLDMRMMADKGSLRSLDRDYYRLTIKLLLQTDDIEIIRLAPESVNTSA